MLATITEPIDVSWQNELIVLEVADPAIQGICNQASGAVLPAQVLNSRPGTAEPRRLAVQVQLAPRETLTLDAGPAVSGANPFTVTEQSDRLEISNGCLRVHVPRSGDFSTGMVNGPIISMGRVASDRMWGQGQWGPAAFAGRIETIVLDSGPLLCRWVVRYLIGGSEMVSYDCLLHADTDFVWVRERSPLSVQHHPDPVAFNFRLSGEDAPEHWFTYGGGEAERTRQDTLNHPPERRGIPRPGELMHVDFNSGHNQMSWPWAGFWREHGPVLGVTELRGGHWEFPGLNRISILGGEDEVNLFFATRGGSREYALVCGLVDEYLPTSGLSRFCYLHRKYSDLPLEKVRHWVVDWTLQPASEPRLYPADALAKATHQIEAWPKLADAYRQWLAGGTDTLYGAAMLPAWYVTRDTNLKDQLLQFIDTALETGLDHALNNGYLRLIIFDGRSLKVLLEAIDVLRAIGEVDEEWLRPRARRIAFLSYCFADPDFWPYDCLFRAREDQRGHGTDYWDDIGDIICPPNFSTEYFTSFAITGLTFPEHPAAAQWIAAGTQLMERQLEANFYESGGYIESANYHDHEAIMLMQLATALWSAGRRDFYKHPRFKRNFGFFTNMLTPPVMLTPAGEKAFNQPNFLNPPAAGPVHLVTNWGNTGHDCSGEHMPYVVPVAAGIYADRDPEYARSLMTAWRKSPQMFAAHYGAFSLLVFGQPQLTDTPLRLESGLVEGLAAVFRSGQDTPNEVFGWVKCGPATHHNCRDEGGLVLYAYGAPVIGDFGYHTIHNGKQESGAETWKHACVSFGGRTISAGLGTEISLPPKRWISTAEYDLLECYLPQRVIVPEDVGYLCAEVVDRIEYTRTIVFVKPNVFLIHDHIAQTTLPPTCWVHALADQVEVQGQQARFIGRHGVDLQVQMLHPRPTRVETGTYSVQLFLRMDLPGPGDFLTALIPVWQGQQAPVVSFDTGTRLLRLQTESGERVLPCPLSF